MERSHYGERITAVPVTPVISYAQDGFIAWSGINLMSDEVTYEIRYKQSGSQNFTNIFINRTLLAYTLLNLETGVRYTVEVNQMLAHSY